MSKIIPACCLLFVLLPGCSAEKAKRAMYDSLTNQSEMDCRSNPGAACREHQSYDEYQRDLKRQQ